MKNVAIITTFRDAQEAYSLNRVVINQLKMFIHAGYNVKVVVCKGFRPEGWYAHKQVTCVEIPDVPVSNSVDIDKTFNEDVSLLLEAFRGILRDVDVAITHDIVYQPACIKHNTALRTLVLEDKSIKTLFLHWIHSATTPAIVEELRGGGERYMKSFRQTFPRSFYIAFNQLSVPRIASWFKIEEDRVKYVPHPHDFLEYKDPLVEKLFLDYNLLSKDVICAYPVRLDRGKQVEAVVKIMAQVKKLNRSVCLIVADFHSTGGDKVTYRNELKNLGISLGLTESDLIFLSEFDRKEGEGYRGEISHKAIQEIFSLTNVFVMPSRSETYSLVTQEAIANRNFVVLNQDLTPLRSIFGDDAYYRQFSSNINANTGLDGETNVAFQNEEEYHKGTAQYINYVLENTRVLALHNKIRKTKNLDYVFRYHIEPLLYADPKQFNY